MMKGLFPKGYLMFTTTKDIPKGMKTAKADASLLSTLIGAGLSGALIAKIFNDYMQEHGDELVPQWLPDWVKDIKQEDGALTGTLGLKAGATAAKATVAAKRGIASGTKKAVKKVSTSKGAKNATKKILMGRMIFFFLTFIDRSLINLE